VSNCSTSIRPIEARALSLRPNQLHTVEPALQLFVEDNQADPDRHCWIDLYDSSVGATAGEPTSPRMLHVCRCSLWPSACLVGGPALRAARPRAPQMSQAQGASDVTGQQLRGVQGARCGRVRLTLALLGHLQALCRGCEWGVAREGGGGCGATAGWVTECPESVSPLPQQ